MAGTALGTGIRGLAGAMSNTNVLLYNATATAFVKGTIYYFDLADSGTNISAANELLFAPGSTTQDPTYYIEGTQASTAQGLYCVVLTDLAASTEGLFCVQGICQVLVGAAQDQGDFFASDASGDAVDVTGGDTPLGVFLQETAADGDLAWSMFDGIHGIGTVT